MSQAASQAPTASEERPLIFPWRRRPRRLLPGLAAGVIALLGFGVLLALVQIRVVPPQFEMERQGSLIYLPATGDGLAWATRAKEAGPLLSRYEPTTWDGYPAMDAAVTAAMATASPPHRPQPRELPVDKTVRPPALAAAGEAVFPKPPPATPPAPPQPCVLVPVLYPLSKLGSASLPQDLPPLPDPVDPALAAVDWQFLIHLRPDGGVAECLALNQSTGPGAARLETWLHGVAFDPKLAAPGDWIAVGIRFHNQPADGADDH